MYIMSMWDNSMLIPNFTDYKYIYDCSIKQIFLMVVVVIVCSDVKIMEHIYGPSTSVPQSYRDGGGGPERTGPRPPPWVPLLKNLIMVAVSFPPV